MAHTGWLVVPVPVPPLVRPVAVRARLLCKPLGPRAFTHPTFGIHPHNHEPPHSSNGLRVAKNRDLFLRSKKKLGLCRRRKYSRGPKNFTHSPPSPHDRGRGDPALKTEARSLSLSLLLSLSLSRSFSRSRSRSGIYFKRGENLKIKCFTNLKFSCQQ